MSHSFVYLTFVLYTALFASDLFVLCYVLITRFMFLLFVLYLFKLSCMFCSLFCVFCVFVFFVIVSPYVYICFFSICLECADHRHGKETQLQLKNIVSYHMSR
jgi:hypothetical protein